MEFVKKKILWFTHNDCGYNRLFYKDQNISHTGTWTETIANLFKKEGDFELAVSFRSRWYSKIVRKKNITYYPVFLKTKRNKVNRVLGKINSTVPWYDEMDDYMKIINDFKPDLIHVFGSEENFGFISKYTKIPVVLSIQGNLTVYNWKYFSGVSKGELFYSFDFEKIIRLSISLLSYQIFKKKALREQEIFKNIKYVIGRTDWDKRVSRVLSPKSKYYYNDEVLRDQFYIEPPVNSIIKNSLIITTMSGPAVYKGLETVCMGINILNQLNIDFIWNIGGVSENENLVKAVKKKLKKEFPCKNIKFLGKLNELEIVDLLKKTNIYVLPSHIENSPLTLSEAMILGLPIVCSLAGGTSSRLTDKKEGLLIQSGDPWSLVGSILELKENYEQAKIYGKNARKRAMHRHYPKRIINDLKNIYIDVLKMEN